TTAMTFKRDLEQEVASHVTQLNARATALGDEIKLKVDENLESALSSLAGLTKLLGADLFPGVKLCCFENPEWLTIQHGQDRARKVGWTKLSVDLDGKHLTGAPKLIEVG